VEFVATGPSLRLSVRPGPRRGGRLVPALQGGRAATSTRPLLPTIRTGGSHLGHRVSQWSRDVLARGYRHRDYRL